MTIKDRFDFLINHYAHGNKRAFSGMIEVSPSVIENIVGTRGGNPSFEVLQKTLCAFEHVSPKWLVAGQGEAFMEEKYSDLPVGVDVELQTFKSLPSEKNKVAKNMTNDERIDALIRQNDALTETNAKLAQSVQDAIKMTHDTIAANQRQGEANQEIMKQLLFILEDSKKNLRAEVVPDVAARRTAHG